MASVKAAGTQLFGQVKKEATDASSKSKPAASKPAAKKAAPKPQEPKKKKVYTFVTYTYKYSPLMILFAEELRTHLLISFVSLCTAGKRWESSDQAVVSSPKSSADFYDFRP
ncbi:hypothetical protein Goshw_024540 [Gossypium schwendimanii]|uniref:Uncharacterized protein n=2 Tax=Gossypium TaxID=3633 RepID=A0A7J9LYT6_GOSSC|nr:hypothetical protein [Gossypium schwendimanii]